MAAPFSCIARAASAISRTLKGPYCQPSGQIASLEHPSGPEGGFRVLAPDHVARIGPVCIACRSGFPRLCQGHQGGREEVPGLVIGRGHVTEVPARGVERRPGVEARARVGPQGFGDPRRVVEPIVGERGVRRERAHRVPCVVLHHRVAALRIADDLIVVEQHLPVL